MERVNCERKDCKNNALIYGWGKWLCGDCFMLIKNTLDKKQKEEIEKI